MAEMTVAEAKIFIAKELKALSGPEGCCVKTMQRNQEKRNSLRQIATLLGEQAAEIEQQNRDIAKLQDDLIKAINGRR